MPATSHSDDGPFDFERPGANMHKLMQWLAQDHSTTPILSYPNTQGDYSVNLTGSEMEHLTAFAASRYAEAFRKLPDGEVTGDIGFGGLDTKVVAMVTTSTLTSFITFVALHRLGFSAMVISPRLAESGYAHLLRVVGTHAVVVGVSSMDVMSRVKKTYEGTMDIVPMLSDDEILAGLKSSHVELADPACCPGVVVQYVYSAAPILDLEDENNGFHMDIARSSRACG